MTLLYTSAAIGTCAPAATYAATEWRRGRASLAQFLARFSPHRRRVPQGLKPILSSPTHRLSYTFDYDPPPKAKPMEWTIRIANGTGTWVYEDATAGSIPADLDRSTSLPGAYFDIDRSQVRSQLETKLTFRAENFTWLQLLAKVADAVSADIVITPGKFTLVPSSKRKAATPNAIGWANPFPLAHLRC